MHMKVCALISVVLMASCAPVRIVSTQSNVEDFSAYETYNYFPPDGTTGPYYNELIASIDRELAAKGMVKSDNPSLRINIGTSIKDVSQSRETDYRDIRYTGQRNYQWESEELVVYEYREGSAVLDFVDEATGKLLWQGIAAGTLDSKEDRVISRIDKAMAKLFSQFPK